MSVTKISDVDLIRSALSHAVKQEIVQIISEEISSAKENVEARVNEMTDKIALQILSSYTVEREGTSIIIRVIK